MIHASRTGCGWMSPICLNRFQGLFFVMFMAETLVIGDTLAFSIWRPYDLKGFVEQKHMCTIGTALQFREEQHRHIFRDQVNAWPWLRNGMPRLLNGHTSNSRHAKFSMSVGMTAGEEQGTLVHEENENPSLFAKLLMYEAYDKMQLQRQGQKTSSRSLVCFACFSLLSLARFQAPVNALFFGPPLPLLHAPHRHLHLRKVKLLAE
jgi:hypothetical protein